MKDIPVSPGARKIRAWVSEGEHEQQDFKLTVPEARKIARSISAFANNRGGRLLIGVKDNGMIAGVRNEEDIYVLEQAAERYCRPAQELDFHAYSVDTRVTVIVATVAAASEKPVEVMEADGTFHAYFRVADENIAAHPLMVEGWRQRARGAGASFSLGPDESRILRLLQSGTPLDSEEIALRLHLSSRRTDALLGSLAALGAIDFVFDGTRFKITGA